MFREDVSAMIMMLTGGATRRWLWCAFLSMALCVSVLYAQTQQRIEIRGLVVDAASRQPVAGVQVTLAKRVLGGQQILDERTVTDSRGRFTVRAPSTGEYTLHASKAPHAFGGYGPNALSQSPLRWFTVTGPKADIVIELWERPVVAGQVLDENSQPLPRALVLALQPSVLGGRQVLRSSSRTSAGADGRYVIRLSAGEYVLAAMPSLGSTGPARPLQFYPFASAPGGAVPVSAEPSKSIQGIDFHLRRQPGFTIAGHLAMPPGVSGRNWLELYRWSPDDVPTNLAVGLVPVSPTGQFSFPAVVAGAYEIRFVRYPERPPGVLPDGAVRTTRQRMGPERLASLPEGDSLWLAERVDVIDKDVNVSLRLGRGVRVSGRLVFEGSGPKPAASLLPTRGVYLRSVDHRFFRPIQLGPPRDDGTFSTLGVPPGRYVLGMLDAYPGFELRSVRLGGRDVTGVSFDLDADVSNAVLTFAPGTTRIAGSIAGDPDQNRFVLIWPEAEALWSGSGTQLGRIYRAVTTEGPYSLPVFPGTYRVVALPGLPPRDWESPALLRSLVRLSQRLVVPAGSTVAHNPPLVERR
jgi:hypothetical protein